MIREILKLGDPRLYEISALVEEADRAQIAQWTQDLHDTLMDFRKTYGAGRAVAAPQIGVFKRMIYLHIDRPWVLLNPTLTFPDEETYTLLDDCMSFPGLLVRVERHRRAVLSWQDENFNAHAMTLEGDLSELVQHEYDHLDGILATMRAVDNKSLFMKQMKRDFA